MGIFEQYQTMAKMAASSLHRIGELGAESLGVPTLAMYMKTDNGRFSRVFALPGSPNSSEDENNLVSALAGEQLEVVEDSLEHPALAAHSWVTGDSGWRFVASAPLTPSKSPMPVGYLIVADQHARSLDETAQARLVDLADVLIERVELQRTQAEVAAEMDRMITIGILAAGVAHEINNPLSFVGGNIQFALRLLDKGLDKGLDTDVSPEECQRVGEIKEALEDALAGSRRVHDVVKDLHRLAGGSTNDDFTIEAVNIIEPLTSSLNIARKHIEQRARLVTNLDPVADVMGNQSKLGQVFLNLLINAAQAIPKGDFDSNEVRVSTANRDGDVVVSIRDSGTGISEDDLAHIFDPFFTTKPRNEGTGLGLAISHNIVTTLSGDIEIETEPGEGTAFTVVLPSAAKATTPLPTQG
jgi:signal transduction histidine kinase